MSVGSAGFRSTIQVPTSGWMAMGTGVASWAAAPRPASAARRETAAVVRDVVMGRLLFWCRYGRDSECLGCIVGPGDARLLLSPLERWGRPWGRCRSIVLAGE